MLITLINAHSPKWANAEHTIIDLMCNFEHLPEEYVPFSANPNDSCEHGRIILNIDGDWDEFKDQYLMYPTKNVHDDLMDSLAYINQMAVTSYRVDEEDEEYEPIEIITGI